MRSMHLLILGDNILFMLSSFNYIGYDQFTLRMISQSRHYALMKLCVIHHMSII